jgi:hypothetical protein
LSVRRMTRVVALAVAAVILVSCGGDRPDEAEWSSLWQSVRQTVPDRSALDGPEAQRLCSDALAAIRDAQVSLIPTPSSALDDPMRNWIDTAEETFFECPPREADLQGFDVAYERLSIYEIEIEAALEG